MKIVVWGCRGSIPAPGPDTLRYGGESTCIEVRADNGEVIIIDAGSGIRKLGQQLLKDKSVKNLTLLLTHAHWDHLSGFPFFRPAFSPAYTISLCGGPDAQQSVQDYLSHQMDPPYFPIDFKYLKARFINGCSCDKKNCIQSLTDMDRCIVCESIPLNHPNGGYGFKLTSKGASFVFLTDNELRYHHEGGLQREEYVEFCRNAGLLFHDAHYLEAEYANTRSWGHSTVRDAVDLALDAGVKKLGLFHHDPDRTDDEIDRQVDWCRKYIESRESRLDCFACAEGLEFVI
jgi:phosphoribosyl 1,2-cyclic phosphodiesterase